MRHQFTIFKLLFFLIISSFVLNANARTVIVSNVLANSVTLLDENTLLPINEIKVGYMPHEVAISNDGKTAIVANFGDLLKVFPGETLTTIDIPNARAIKTIQLPAKSRPHGIAVISDRQALVTAQGIQALLVVDFVDGKVERTIPLPSAGAHMVIADQAKQFAYIGNVDSGKVTKLDLRNFTIVAELKIGKEAEGLALSKGEDLLFVTNRTENFIAVVRTKDLSLHKKIPTGKGPVRVVMFNDGQNAVITNTLSGNAQVIDVASLSVAKTFNTNTSSLPLPIPINVAIRDDQKTAYITNFVGNNVALVDLVQGHVIKTFQAGFMPDGVGTSPSVSINNDDSSAYVVFTSGPIEINANIENVWRVAKNVNDYQRISHGAITAHVDGDLAPGKSITLELFKNEWIGKLIPQSIETVSMVDDTNKILGWTRKLPSGDYTQRYQFLQKLDDNRTSSMIVLRIPEPLGTITNITLGKVINKAFNDLNLGIKAEAERS